MNWFQRAFYNLAKGLVYPFSYCVQGVRFRYNGLKLPAEPTLFLSNHASNWDPIWLNLMFMKRDIHFMATEELFVNKLFRLVFQYILEESARSEKATGVSDVMGLVRYKKKGYDIGVYPEGDIDMFAGVMNKNEKIAKLAKLLKMPVAILTVEGSYSRMPRWNNDKARRSKIVYTLRRILTVDEINKLDVSSLSEIIWDGITTNEEEYRKQRKIIQKKGHLAEWLEAGIFYCPRCGKYETMKSKGDDFYCRACGYTVTLTPEGEINSADKVYYRTIFEWNRGQLNDLKRKISALKENEVFLTARDLPFRRAAYDTKFQKDYELVTLNVATNGITIVFSPERSEFIPYDEIDKTWVFRKEIVAINAKDEKYRFNIDNRRFCAYLYVQTILALKEKNTQRK